VHFLLGPNGLSAPRIVMVAPRSGRRWYPNKLRVRANVRAGGLESDCSTSSATCADAL